MVLARRLGWQVSIDCIARDFKIKRKLPNEVESFSLAKNHTLFQFKSEEERGTILHGGPWVVIGQLLALEPWVPNFMPGTNFVKMMMVWMWLPAMPIEF